MQTLVCRMNVRIVTSGFGPLSNFVKIGGNQTATAPVQNKAATWALSVANMQNQTM